MARALVNWTESLASLGPLNFPDLCTAPTLDLQSQLVYSGCPLAKWFWGT